ncbi:MAG TPA: type II toxin-antitoxin system HicA family toxin [Verrucomicrobiae bacterium]|nr:type II toxin-antitoxin system HicA family toxin [Verrucomicrobiae bacterium]
MLQTNGWRLVVTKGSHRQFKHSTKPGRVTVSGIREMTCRREHWRQ